MKSKFIVALQEQLQSRANTCIRGTNINADKYKGKNTRGEHLSYFKSVINAPFPEIFNLNLNWTIDPKPTSILKSLVSIP